MLTHCWHCACSKHPQVVEAFTEGARQQSGAPYVADLVTLLAPREFPLRGPGPSYIVAAANDPVAPPVFARNLASRCASCNPANSGR